MGNNFWHMLSDTIFLIKIFVYFINLERKLKKYAKNNNHVRRRKYKHVHFWWKRKKYFFYLSYFNLIFKKKKFDKELKFFSNKNYLLKKIFCNYYSWDYQSKANDNFYVVKGLKRKYSKILKKVLLLKKTNKIESLVGMFERRVSIVLFRTLSLVSLQKVNVLLKNGFIFVNNNQVKNPGYFLKNSSILQRGSRFFYGFLKLKDKNIFSSKKVGNGNKSFFSHLLIKKFSQAFNKKEVRLLDKGDLFF